MKIAVLGATGRAGSRIVAEALKRGHEITAIARTPEKSGGARPNLVLKKGDANNPDALAKLIAGHDVVVSALRFVDADPNKLIAAVKKSGVPRYLVVGGAGSLEVAPSRALVDMPDFPAAYRPESSAGRDFLNVLRGERDLDWTFLSPSASFAPGERTGKFRVGGDQLLTAADGKSSISMEDYAIAFLDEVEKPQHRRQRFTVGY